MLARARVRVFEAHTGQPVTEPLWFADKVLDLSFLSDGATIRVIDAAGGVTEQTVHQDQPHKPRWLANLASALTGREIGRNQEASLMSQADYQQARQELLDQLHHDAATNPSARLILHRLGADRLE